MRCFHESNNLGIPNYAFFHDHKKNLGPTISTNCRTLSKIASSVGSLARPFSLSYLDVVEALFSKVMGDERSIGPDMDMKKI